MSSIVRQPCDEGVMRPGGTAAPVAPAARPWILAATILASGLAFIDGTAVNVALPSLPPAFRPQPIAFQGGLDGE